MEAAAEKLEALMTCAENALGAIEIQLETEMTRQSGIQVNPVSVFTAIEDSKKELADLKKEISVIVQAQSEVKTQLTGKVEVLCKQLQEMEKKLGSGNSLSSNAGSVMKSHLRM